MKAAGYRPGRVRGPPRNRRSFTLIELLVVTAILAVVVAAVAGCIAGGIRVWDAARSFGAVEVETTTGLRAMERDLRNAFRFYAIPFDGDSGRVAFPAVIEAEPAEGGGGKAAFECIGTVAYEFDRAGGKVLRKQWSFPDGPVRSERVLSHVEDFALSYFAEADDVNKTAGWTDAWSQATNYPGRVMIRLTVRPTQARTVTEERLVLLPIPNTKPEGK